jgi:WD40 repeat protein
MTERTVFLAALDITDSRERLAYLDRAGAGDALGVPAVEQMARAARPPAGSEGATGSFPPDAQAAANPAPEEPTRTQAERPGGLLRTLTGQTGRVYAVAFSLDSRSLAAASWDGDKAVRVWNLAKRSRFTDSSSNE